MVMEWITGDEPRVWTVTNPQDYIVDRTTLPEGMVALISVGSGGNYISHIYGADGKHVSPITPIRLPDTIFGAEGRLYKPRTNNETYRTAIRVELQRMC